MSRLRRKRAVLVVLAALVWGAPPLCAREPDSAAVAELLAFDKAWIDAEVHRDRAALERILDEEFLATFVSGRTVDRTTFVERIMHSTIEPFEVNHEAIRVYGDVALVIDTSMDRKAKYSWIAVKHDGQWRVISETFTSVESR